MSEPITINDKISNYSINYTTLARGKKPIEVNAQLDENGEIWIGDITGSEVESFESLWTTEEPKRMVRDKDKKYFLPKDTLEYLPDDHYLNKEYNCLMKELSKVNA